MFSLQQALKTYDGVQERIVAYEKEIVRKLGEMERDEQQGQTAPPLSLSLQTSHNFSGGRLFVCVDSVPVTRLESAGV